MSSQNPHQKSFVAGMTIIVFLAIVPATLAQTETRRPPQGISTPKVRIFKSKGVPHLPQDPGPDAPSPPTPLSAAEKSQILKSLNIPGLTAPGSVYVRLNPRKNGVEGKGFLTFRNTSGVYGEYQRASWASPAYEHGKYVRINLKSEAAGRRYLIECAVGSGPVNGGYKIWKGNDDVLDAFGFLQKIGGVASSRVQHLVFVLDATDNGWHAFSISGDSVWYFYSCEVTSF